eukprot:Hpha_TRINITY_DN33667_c0_g1::TRINITY_DN33667_c0_g1_i1::g.43268::m.43268
MTGENTQPLGEHKERLSARQWEWRSLETVEAVVTVVVITLSVWVSAVAAVLHRSTIKKDETGLFSTPPPLLGRRFLSRLSTALGRSSAQPPKHTEGIRSVPASPLPTAS